MLELEGRGVTCWLDVPTSGNNRPLPRISLEVHAILVPQREGLPRSCRGCGSLLCLRRLKDTA